MPGMQAGHTCLGSCMLAGLQSKLQFVETDCCICGCRLFSIDPPTARDLDDALSIEPLPNGHFRVGVHIADVAHFIKYVAVLSSIHHVCFVQSAAARSMIWLLWHDSAYSSTICAYTSAPLAPLGLFLFCVVLHNTCASLAMIDVLFTWQTCRHSRYELLGPSDPQEALPSPGGSPIPRKTSHPQEDLPSPGGPPTVIACCGML